MKKQLFILVVLSIALLSCKNNDVVTVKLTPSFIPTDGLIAWYPFNGNVNDESGNGNNGTITGIITASNDRFGVPNSSYSFTGSGCIKLPSINLPSFTLNAWVKRLGNGSGVICKHYAGTFNSSYLLFATEEDLSHPSIYYTSTSNIAYNTGTTQQSWSDSKWHMLTASLSTASLKFYFDGVLQSQKIGGTAKSTTFATLIGGGYSNSGIIDYLNFGNIDDVGFWNRVLTPDEITALYNAK